MAEKNRKKQPQRKGSNPKKKTNRGSTTAKNKQLKITYNSEKSIGENKEKIDQNLFEKSLELSTWKEEEPTVEEKQKIEEVNIEDSFILRNQLFDEVEGPHEEEQKEESKNQEFPILEKMIKKEDIKRSKDLTKHRSSLENRKKILLDGILLIIAIVIFSVLLSITPKIYIKGENSLKIDYNTAYQDRGATAKYFNKDYTDKIKVEGTVDTSKVGTYTITYTLKFSSFHLEKKRTVEVVDRKPPVIELTGDKQVKICPNGKYEEEGVKATDEYDGNLTEKIEIKQEKGKIIYSVKDSSLNEAKEVRELVEIDEESPTIHLAGSKTIYVDYKGTYKEPGYEASDNCDGTITEKVIVRGTVDPNKLGTYTLTYEVTDTSGNKAEEQRTIIVSNRTDPESGTLKTGAIYLTFDDGPNSGTTNRILDILKEEGVKATFFVTCNGPDSLLKREYDEGHAIALHTATHNYAYLYKSEENYFEDLKRVSDRVKNVTGHESKLIRFPGGSSNTVSRHYNQGIMTRLTNEVLERGYRYYDWNVDASDAWQCTKQNVTDKSGCVYNNVTRNLYKSRANVVLMHDVKEHTVGALRNIIRYGKENGYTFEVIDTGTKMVRFKVNN